MAERLRGNWATLLLPIAADDAIDFTRLDDEIAALIGFGVDGIYSNGTAGEFHNQTEDEFDRIQRMLADRCRRSGMRFVIGACHSDPMIQRQRIARAATLEPTAIQFILPDWVRVSLEEARDALLLAEEAAGDTPLVLYNPPHAKRVLSPEEMGALLSAATNVGAIKVGDGDAGWYASARAHLQDISVFVPGHHLATGVREGVAAGAFSNVACLSPGGAQRWTDQMATQLDECLDVERRLRAFLDEHIAPFARAGYCNAALDKLLAAVGDWAPVGVRLRRPYRWIDAEHAARLRPLARAATPELFD